MKSADSLMAYCKDNAIKKLDNIKSVIIVTLLIIEIVGFLVVFTLFPIYSLIQ